MELNYLKRSLELAKQAADKGNYPIGAVLTTIDGELIAEGENTSFTEYDPSGHAELNALRQVGEEFSDAELIMYCSLEPCFGCSFFLRYANVSKVIWALSDPYKGGFTKLTSLEDMKEDLAKIEIVSEPDEEIKEESRRLMFEFLSNRNKQKAAQAFKLI